MAKIYKKYINREYRGSIEEEARGRNKMSKIRLVKKSAKKSAKICNM